MCSYMLPIPGGGTMQDNYVTDWIEEKTNIHLNFVYDVDGDEAKTKLNLVMTDPDSMPDIFLATRWSKAETALYAEQGLILPLDDYLKDATRWNELNEISPMRKGDLVLSDGHIYTYGGDGESFHNNYQNRVWIYKPWVDQLETARCRRLPMNCMTSSWRSRHRILTETAKMMKSP